jgi:thioredoxin 1
MDELEVIRARKMEELLRRARAPVEPIEVSDTNFSENVDRPGLVVIDCWAEWCGPCKMISPIIDQLAKEYAGKVLFGKLNVDQNPVTTTKFDIMSIPTLLIFKDSKIVERIVGAVSKGYIESLLNKLI